MPIMNKRTYEDGCAGAHALDLIGERWALLVVREMVLGPKRFTDLRAGLPGISPNVLTQRLEELEAAAIVRRHKLPPPASSWVYELTEWGAGLGPLIMELGRWAASSPHLPQGLPMSTDSMVLSMRTMFSGEAAGDLNARLEFRFGEDVFQAEVKAGQFKIERGAARQPEVIITADPNALAAVIYGGVKLADAQRAGDVIVEGDKSAAKRFVTCFPLPETAPLGA